MHTEEEKLSLISQLIELSKADGYVSPDEIQFIHTISQMIGVSEEQTYNLFEKPHPFRAPKSEYDRIIQFHRMVLLMNVDYEVHENELREIKNLGLKMGLPPQAILEVLQEMKNHHNHVIPPEKLLRIFTKYHN